MGVRKHSKKNSRRHRRGKRQSGGTDGNGKGTDGTPVYPITPYKETLNYQTAGTQLERNLEDKTLLGENLKDMKLDDNDTRHLGTTFYAAYKIDFNGIDKDGEPIENMLQLIKHIQQTDFDTYQDITEFEKKDGNYEYDDVYMRHNNLELIRNYVNAVIEAAKPSQGGYSAKSYNKKKGGGKNKSKSAFSNYLDNLAKSLDVKKGGAYSVDVENMIAGRPTYKSYEDCAPPVVLGGKLVDKPCGTGCNLTGGKRSKKSKKLSRRNRKRNRKTKRGGGKSHKKSKRKSAKSVNKMRRKRKTQSAGGRLAPNKYPFNGEDNVMTPDMTKREFGCRQPKWNPKCI